MEFLNTSLRLFPSQFSFYWRSFRSTDLLPPHIRFLKSDADFVVALFCGTFGEVLWLLGMVSFIKTFATAASLGSVFMRG